MSRALSDAMKILRSHHRSLLQNEAELVMMHQRFLAMYPSYEWAHQHIEARMTEIRAAIEQNDASIKALAVEERITRQREGRRKAAETRQRKKEGAIA